MTGHGCWKLEAYHQYSNAEWCFHSWTQLLIHALHGRVQVHSLASEPAVRVVKHKRQYAILCRSVAGLVLLWRSSNWVVTKVNEQVVTC